MNNAPIIIFDGPDNVGKGTQIKRIRKHFKSTAFNITNLDKPIGDTLENKEGYGLKNIDNQLATMVAGSSLGIPQLADRGHYSEYAYSTLRTTHDIKTISDIENKYISHNKHILGIIFIDTAENISERDDGKSNYNKDDLDMINTIINRFKEVSEESLFAAHIVNIDGKDADTVEKEVVSIISDKFSDLN